MNTLLLLIYMKFYLIAFLVKIFYIQIYRPIWLNLTKPVLYWFLHHQKKFYSILQKKYTRYKAYFFRISIFFKSIYTLYIVWKFNYTARCILYIADSKLRFINNCFMINTLVEIFPSVFLNIFTTGGIYMINFIKSFSNLQVWLATLYCLKLFLSMNPKEKIISTACLILFIISLTFSICIINNIIKKSPPA